MTYKEYKHAWDIANRQRNREYKRRYREQQRLEQQCLAELVRLSLPKKEG